MADATPSASVAPPAARVLLLVEHRENRRLLAEWLGPTHEVSGAGGPPRTPPDLVIVDRAGLNSARQRILEAKVAASPAFLPSLLVINRRQVARFGGELLSPAVDEVITTPIEKVELRARLESLLHLRHMSLDAARNALRRYRELFDNVPVGLYVADESGTLTDANPALARLLRAPDRSSLLGTELADVFVHDDDRRRWRDCLAGEGTASEFEAAVRRSDDTTGWLSLTVQVVRDADGRVARSEGSAADVSDRRLAAEMLHAQAGQQTAIAALGRAALSGKPIDAVLGRAAEVVTETLATDRTEILDLLPAAKSARLRAAAGISLDVDRSVGLHGTPRGTSDPIDLSHYRAGGVIPPPPRLSGQGLTAAAGVVIEGRGRPTGVLTTYTRSERSYSPQETDFLQAVANILGLAVERHEIEADLRHQALHDDLTGLPNRVLALERLTHALQNLSRHPDRVVGVLFLDIDRFKLVNDQFGHDAGDQLLVQLAQRIVSVLRPGDTVARLGGDEFVVICEGLSGQAQAIAVAKRISDIAREPVALVDRDVAVTVSIGVALGKKPDTSPDALLSDADAALYQSKGRGRGGYAIFSEPLRTSQLRRLDLEEALGGAVGRDELVVQYQPVIDLSDGHVWSVEALLRWRHPQRGLLSPAQFIGIAEDTGLIVPIGTWILTEAFRQASLWRRQAHHRDIGVAVNLSARQLAQPDLAITIAQAMEEADLPPSFVTLEVTESVGNSAGSIRTLESLKALDVQLSIDDFGTGYSSLAYLSRLPVDVLKVDRSLVLGLPRAQDTAVVGAIVNLGRALGLDVVAEGVENAQQLDAIAALGIGYVQGFHFARPMSPAAVEELLLAAPSLTSAHAAEPSVSAPEQTGGCAW